MAIGVATVLLVLLIIFIAENSSSVTISFLGAHGHISLALALLIAAVVGAAVTLLVGTARILQLRLEVRRNRGHTGTKRRHRLPQR
ncbi:MAG: lipopolysaccharide assembly protein LapA domain-containing protein [Solirubrobacteraceae bacterium]